MTNTRYDVVVAGGGIAGVAAATSAARLSARTLLVERYGFLGGMATAGLVNPFMSWRSSDGTPLISGVFDELLDRLSSLDGLRGSTFDSEAMKLACQEMVLESGAELLLHTWAIGAVTEGTSVTGIRTVSKSGKVQLLADRVVDATGDGDVATDAGADFQKGGPDGLPQAMTLMVDVGGVDLSRALSYVRDHPDQMRFPKLPQDAKTDDLADGVVSVAGYYDLVAEARARGDYPLPGDLVFYIGRPRQGEVVFNTTHIGGVDGTQADDLTRAEVEGRRQAAALVRFARENLPGFENAFLLRTATQVGVRETRRITGEYVFSADDVARAAKFGDAIARLAYPVDVHHGRGDGYAREEERSGPVAPPPGDWYEIPYRCLVPAGIENLLVAGRCVSSTQEGHGAIRVMPCCAAMGQAAGAAAAISLQDGVTPRRVETGKLLAALREQGALV